MPGEPKAPTLLRGHARDIWVAAFQAAYGGTCAEQEDRDGCAAAVAWAAVKRRYRRTAEGDWVPRGTETGGVTMADSTVERKDYSPETRKEYAKKGWALPDGSYPIADKGDLMDAIRSYGRAPLHKRAAVRRHIMKRARQLGAMDMVPEEWRMAVKRAMDAYAERKAARQAADERDWAVIRSRAGMQEAVRPPHISGDEWRRRKPEERTVGALLFEQVCIRSYEQALEDAILAGWTPYPVPGRPEEWAFRREVVGQDGTPVLENAVLTRRRGETEWDLRLVSRGLGGSLAVQLPPGEVRYSGPRIIIRSLFPVGAEVEQDA